MKKYYVLEVNKDHSTQLQNFKNYPDAWTAFDNERYAAQAGWPVRLIRVIGSKQVVVARNSKASYAIAGVK
jgi:hypothetical protein